MTQISPDLSKVLFLVVICNVTLMIMTASISVGGSGMHAKIFIKARILIEKVSNMNKCFGCWQLDTFIHNVIRFFVFSPSSY